MGRIDRTVFALLLAAGASACTPMQWTRPDTNTAQFQADATDCRQQAWRESWARRWMYSPPGPVVARDLAGRPFLLWPGYADPFGERFMDEARLADFCMRAKGYELTPAPQGTR